MDDIRDELSGYFMKVLLALLSGIDVFLAKEVMFAIEVKSFRNDSFIVNDTKLVEC